MKPIMVIVIDDVDMRLNGLWSPFGIETYT